METNKSQNKEYKPDHISNPYFGIFVFIIIIGIIVASFIKSSDEIINILLSFRFTSDFFKLIFILFITIAGSIYFFILTRHIFTNCIYIRLTETQIIAKNHFKKELGNFDWNEIYEIYVKKGSYNIKIKNKEGKEIKINTAIGNTEELFNEIIKRSTNVKKIDLTFIKSRYPGISIYEKDLESK